MSGSELHKWRTCVVRGDEELDVDVTIEFTPAEKMTRDYPGSPAGADVVESSIPLDETEERDVAARWRQHMSETTPTRDDVLADRADSEYASGEDHYDAYALRNADTDAMRLEELDLPRARREGENHEESEDGD